MVMGPLTISCGKLDIWLTTEYDTCEHNPVKHVQTVYIEWYTPHAFTRGPDGHGTYSLLAEKQPGTTLYQASGGLSDQKSLTVYVSTAALSGKTSALPGDTNDQLLTNSSPAARDQIFSKLITADGVQKVVDGPLLANTPVSISF
jgi:hypothetical protein